MWGQGPKWGSPPAPLSPPAVWGCPLNLPLHGMGMGTACACAPVYTWFPFCLLAFLVHFKPRVGFTSSPATVSGSLGKTHWGRAGEQWVV